MKLDYAKALKMAVCCQESYQDFSNIVFSGWSKQPTLINQETTDTQLAILTDSSGITIVFPGSSSSTDWITNFSINQQRKIFNQKIIKGQIVDKKDKVYPYSRGKKSGSLMHSGFTNAYFSVRAQVHEYIRDNNISNVTVTGHSLGGGLATLCVVDIQYNFADQLSSLELYTFGAPRVGNEQFRLSYNQRVTNSYQFVYGMDIIPALPRWWQGYKHTHQELRIGPRFSWNFISARFKDHEIAQYINFFQQQVTNYSN